MTAATTIAERALEYARQGLHIFPVKADTKGRDAAGESSHLLTNGHNGASCDPDVVRRWWAQWPDANIGLSLAASGLVALDPDLYKPECAWDAFIADKDVPETWRQRSASGGRHYIYTAPPDASFPGQLCPGVEVKHKGYIMLAPSTFEGRPYEWENDLPPAPVPSWVPRRATTAPVQAAAYDDIPGADIGFLRWALSWFDPDADGRDKWIERLMAVHHESRGSKAGLALAEEWSRQGEKYRPGEVERNWRKFTVGRGATLDLLMRDLPLAAVFAGPPDYTPTGMSLTPVPASAPPAPGQMRGAFTFTLVGDLKARPPEFVIDGMIETETLGVIFADPGSGKSFLAADMAMSVATGETFHGRTTMQGPVFFIAGEGHSGLARRFEAWARHRGLSRQGVPLLKSDRAAQFLDAASARAVSQSVDALAAGHGTPRMIIIDTLARNYGPGDENSTQDMTAFVAAMDDLKARYSGCCVVVVHHSGHGDKARGRGSMALKGAADFEYRLEKDGETISVANLKMKDAPQPPDMAFRLQGVPLDDGAASAVLVPTVAPERGSKMTATHKTALRAFKTAADEQDGWEGLHLHQWSEAFCSAHHGTNPDSKRRIFARARQELVEKGIVSVEDDIYRIIDRQALNYTGQSGQSGQSGQIRICSGVQPGQTGQMPIGMSVSGHEAVKMPK